MITIIPVYDEIGNVRSITLDDGAEPIVLTPEELSALRFAQIEADALREGRKGLLRKIRELECLLSDTQVEYRTLNTLLTAARRAQRVPKAVAAAATGYIPSDDDRAADAIAFLERYASGSLALDSDILNRLDWSIGQAAAARAAEKAVNESVASQARADVRRCYNCDIALDNVTTGVNVVTDGYQRLTVCANCRDALGWDVIATAKGL